MRSLRHWTPRYVVNRLRVLAYQRLHPGEPWLTRDMVELLKTRLTGAGRGLEWGAGRSTLWLAARLGSLVSVEHDEAYCRQVQAALEKKGLRNVDLRFHPAEPDYVAVADTLPPARLDFVLVDGQARDLCALAALPRLKPGGLLVVDNSNLYLPCSSHAPHSRRPADGPASEAWGRFATTVKTWECIWTTNGVWDTALWVKPA